MLRPTAATLARANVNYELTYARDDRVSRFSRFLTFSVIEPDNSGISGLRLG